MARVGSAAALCLALACGGVAAGPAPRLSLAPYEFTARDGTKVAAELGTFSVPENRNKSGSRSISLAFVRFKSTAAKPGNPIVYLAGGPGGSGIGAAQGARFALFMALREVADVIALDQRGVGKSNEIPFCAYDLPPGPIVLTRQTLIDYYRSGLTHCFGWWQGQGVDIDGYTTRESADDLEDLRRALGAPRLNLWGISYGSHLALAYLKYHPARTERAALAGIEGLDQTVKLPAETDALFARVQALIDKDPKAKAVYPDLAGMMRRVHARLDASPAEATFTPQGAAAPVTIRFDGFLIRLLASASIADPPRIANVPLLYLALDHGSYEPAARLIHQFFFSGPAGFAGMPEAMDLASGIDRERLLLVERQAKKGLLGDALNFPMPHIIGIRPGLDLGRAFRSPFRSPAPVLFISGTLDGRTSVPEAKAVLRQFPRGRHLIVENGGHNIFEADKRVADAVVAYFKGAPVSAAIQFDPPAIRTP